MSNLTANPDTTLIVPIDVEALWITEDDIGRLDLAGAFADFSGLTETDFREENITSLKTRKADASDLGVHLQWTLPRPLNFGQTRDSSREKEGDVNFPVAPNRWMISRIVDGSDGAWVQRWIIESDFCDMEPGNEGTSVPVNRGRRYGHARLGRCVPFEQWKESDPSQSCTERLNWPLTAVGWGDPAFAVFYPSCRNVFGFHDPIQDPPEIKECRGRPFTYLVVGWHSRPEDDILANQKNIGTPLPWAKMDDNPIFEKIADMRTCLYSGIVVRKTPGKDRRGDIPTDLFVGNTLEEASAVRHTPNRRHIQTERGEVARLTGLDQSMPMIDRQAAQIDDAIHALRFTSREAGRLWSVRRQIAPGRPEREMEESLALPPALVEAMAEYNAAQKKYDYAVRLWTAHRRRLRDGLALIEGMAVDAPSYESNPAHWSSIRVRLRNRFEEDMGDIFKTDLSALESLLQWAEKSAQQALAAASTPNDPLEIYSLPAPRFWRPRDPVVIFNYRNGKLRSRHQNPPDALFAPENYQPDQKLPHLRCVTGREALEEIQFFRSQVRVPGKYNNTRAVNFLDPEPGMHDLAMGDLPCGEMIKATLLRAMLIHVCYSPIRWIADDKGLPFRPVYLRWRARYLPFPENRVSDTAKCETADSLVKWWRRGIDPGGDQAEMKPCLAGQQGKLEEFINDPSNEILYKASKELFREFQTQWRQTEVVEYSGTTLVDGEAVSKDDRKIPDSEHWWSASLSGLHDQLIGYRAGFGLPLKDRSRLLHLLEIPSWLEDAQPGDDMRPDPRIREFFPLRAGWLMLTEFDIIDTFGRVERMELYRKDSQMTSAGLGSSEEFSREFELRNLVALPPRITVPSRLAFRLRSGDSETTEASASPVHGWIIPSHLEKGFIFCAPDGNMVGILRDAARPGTAPKFMLAPGRKIGELGGLCRDLLGALQNQKIDMLRFRDGLAKEILQIVPEERQHRAGPGHLMGRPLALVTAEIGIDLEGDLPPRRQMPQESEREADRLSDLRVPVLLGDPKRLNDGLTAFFLSNSGGMEFDFTPFFANESKPIILPGVGRHKRVRLLMLMDPQAPVHVTSGLFPVKSIRLPSAHFQAAREKLGVLFPCGPILVPQPTDWSLPLPPVEEQQWHWTDAATVSAGGWMPVPAPPALDVSSDLPAAVRIKSRIWLTLQPGKKAGESSPRAS